MNQDIIQQESVQGTLSCRRTRVDGEVCRRGDDGRGEQPAGCASTAFWSHDAEVIRHHWPWDWADRIHGGHLNPHDSTTFRPTATHLLLAPAYPPVHGKIH